jgi:pyruvate formate lyase activating enzyme
MEARLYTPREDGSVDCHLCAFHCHIRDGKLGICGVRENVGGTLESLVYGRLIAQHIDPIEKKPLYHFLPGSNSYSISTVGCNFRCLHCQNSEISQMPKDNKRIEGTEITPEDLVEDVYSTGCASIAYTYTEPTIFFEYAYDVGVLAREKGIKNVFVTNGFMTRECLAEMDGVLDAANVDIKAFTESFYKKVCGARLAPVLESIERMRSMGVWVELTTLVIPGYNDSEEELRSIAKWIAKTDNGMPWHVSAFHPYYKLLDSHRTPASTLERAMKIGYEEGLKYVYTGNIPGMKGESTLCHSCKKLLIDRTGFTLKNNLVKGSKCPYCGALIDGVFSK